MANKDLINLGITPDSGTGDSARLGGAKINTLFADIYSQYGALAINNDPDGPDYGFSSPLEQFSYKVGELHPAGAYRHVVLSPDSDHGLFNPITGWDDSEFTFISGVRVPVLYTLNNWYFLNRGEAIHLDLTQFANAPGMPVHIVLPLGRYGDSIRIRDASGTWSPNNPIYIYTTPYQFRNEGQVDAFLAATPPGNYPLADLANAVNINTSGIGNNASYKSYNASIAGRPYLNYAYALLTPLWNDAYTEIELTYVGPYEGWVMRRANLNPALALNSIAAFRNFTTSDWVQITEDIIGTPYDSEEVIVPNGWYALQFNTFIDARFSTASQTFSIFRQMIPAATRRNSVPFMAALQRFLPAAPGDSDFYTNPSPVYKQVTLSSITASNSPVGILISEFPFDGVIKFTQGT